MEVNQFYPETSPKKIPNSPDCGDGKYADEFREAEREAREHKRGLWKKEDKINNFLYRNDKRWVLLLRGFFFG